MNKIAALLIRLIIPLVALYLAFHLSGDCGRYCFDCFISGNYEPSHDLQQPCHTGIPQR